MLRTPTSSPFQSSRDLFRRRSRNRIRSGDLRALARRHVESEEGWIRFEQRKTGREVVIPISHDCRLALQRALAGREMGLDDPIFIPDSGLPYSESRMQRHFRIAKRLAGITRRFRVHDPRHSFGCDLATVGLQLRFIGK